MPLYKYCYYLVSLLALYAHTRRRLFLIRTFFFLARSRCFISGSIWGTGGVLYILAKAIKRVMPIAQEPFLAGAVPLTQFQLG